MILSSTVALVMRVWRVVNDFICTLAPDVSANRCGLRGKE